MAKKLLLVLASIPALLLGACGDDHTDATDSRASEPSTTSVHVLHSRNGEQLPIFVAYEQGLFDEHGLDVTLEEAAGAGQITPAIAGGTGDLGLATATDLLLATQEGLDLVFATGTSVNTPENPRLFVHAANGSGIAHRSDLAGRRIAVPSRGSFAEIGAAILLARDGIDADGISWVEVPFPQMNDALNEGVVDAAVVVPPFNLLMQRSGHPAVVDVSELGPSVIVAVLSARREWAEENAEALRGFRAALADAIEMIDADRAMATEVMIEYTGIPPEIAQATPLGNYRAQVTEQEVQLWADLLVESGHLDEDVDAGSLIVPPPEEG